MHGQPCQRIECDQVIETAAFRLYRYSCFPVLHFCMRACHPTIGAMSVLSADQPRGKDTMNLLPSQIPRLDFPFPGRLSNFCIAWMASSDPFPLVKAWEVGFDFDSSMHLHGRRSPSLPHLHRGSCLCFPGITSKFIFPVLSSKYLLDGMQGVGQANDHFPTLC